ncbi:MAG: nucleotidyltransferase and HEPN domain-containing protein [Blastomonas fulva]|jgi:predicted nucleotidyltransferase|uniref:nucleotidyltransferase and HEPN domain-containing protein n=1 Tax=Blastomonas fulva TaxID=1550728 RepID=UPI0024E1DFA5|nr:nucleotidyltransferase and HEPN domain-containing protein [Blastomonas fulva]MDK2757462.1 nucleotidyltransferase and HEPN domain-containing protein [Blastomonas fulva]
MRSDLDHLPEQKQSELRAAVRILFDEFAAAIGNTTAPWKRKGRILKVVLYGSFARGDWVDDPLSGYKSDYDLLVVVNDERLSDVVDYWAGADDHLMREMMITNRLSAPVNFIVHTINDVNRQLKHGRPFFVDIAKQGIALYEAEGFPFVMPTKLGENASLEEARNYFNQWYPSAKRRLQTFRIEQLQAHADAEWRRDAAFTLHQATERLYHCLMLVFTLYSPKSHKLGFLRGHAEELSPGLIAAWPRNDRFSRRCFELLRQAYVNARYSSHYKISEEELDWLGERVVVLQELVRLACLDKIECKNL